jgi:hypothetical protein
MKKSPYPKGASFSEDFLQARAIQAPSISALASSSVSQYRFNTLGNEVERGLYSDGSGQTSDGTTYNSNVVSLVKSAQALGDGSGIGNWAGGGMGNTAMQVPEIYSPLWLTSNLNLPRDRATINAWCRAYFALNPIVHNAIQLHSTYPISKMNIKCADQRVQDFFSEMAEELDLMNKCTQIAQEYFCLGEAYPYAEFDPRRLTWSNITLYNPDFIVVKRTAIESDPIIMLRPDENLKNIVKSNRPSDIEQRRQLDPAIIDAVKRGQNIQLPSLNVSQLARKISPYEIRGTGLPVACFRWLMLCDKLIENKFVQADTMINPLTIVSIGGEGPDALHPTHADLEAWRAVFEAGQNNKDFKIFTHAGIKIDRVGYNQGLVDIANDITLCIKMIYVGLQVPSVLMDGGQDTTYANGGVALDVLRQRYLQFRNMMSLWLRRKIFAPISELQGFYENKDGKKRLIVPDVEWNHMSLFDAGDYITTLVNLTTPSTGEGAPPPRVSNHTLYRSLGLEFEDEQRKLRKEAVANAIAVKEQAELAKMKLDELRSLDPDEDIPESAEGDVPLPGEVPGGGAPSGMPGLPGETPPPAPGGLGGLPGLGAPPEGGANAAPPPPAGAPPGPEAPAPTAPPGAPPPA